MKKNYIFINIQSHKINVFIAFHKMQQTQQGWIKKLNNVE